MHCEPNDVIKMVVTFLPGGTVTFKNVFHAQLQGGYGNPTFEEVLTDAVAYIESIYSPWMPRVASAFANPLLEVWKVGRCTGGEWEDDILIGEQALTLAGTSLNESLPLQVAALLVARTMCGKSRGRKFLPPPTEAFCSGSNLTAQAVTSLGEALVAYISDFGCTLGCWAPGVWSYATQPGQPAPECPVFRPFIGGFVRDVVATWRKRKPGVGI